MNYFWNHGNKTRILKPHDANPWIIIFICDTSQNDTKQKIFEATAVETITSALFSFWTEAAMCAL